MRTNHSPSPVPSVALPNASEMAAYDALPPELRRFVAEAPIRVAVQPILAGVLAYGAAWTLALLERQQQQYFPGYRPV